jgi:predicted transcriptional regulator
MTEGTGATAEKHGWTFLTNHMHVLLCISRDPTVRLRDVALLVGITERAAQSIVADLVAEGYLSRSRVGRRNHYEVHAELPLRHQLERDHSVSELLHFLNPVRGRTRAARSQAS